MTISVKKYMTYKYCVNKFSVIRISIISSERIIHVYVMLTFIVSNLMNVRKTFAIIASLLIGLSELELVELYSNQKHFEI